MNRNLRSLFISFLFVQTLSPAIAEVDLTKLVEKIQPAVVTIITYDKDNKPISQGTGFFIDKNGYLITNYHVFNGASSADVLTYNRKKYPIKFVIAENKSFDLLKISVDIGEDSVRWINVSSTLPKIAERIITIGSPMGLEQTVSEGIISAIRDLPPAGKLFQISASISPGSSGSPVVNMNGEVIGVATFQLIEGQNLNFAIPGEYVKTLNPLKPKTIANWNYGTLRKKTDIEISRKSRLYITTKPVDAKIRILNIKPKYYPGIKLKGGRYLIEVSSGGYEKKKIWVTLAPGKDKYKTIKLKKAKKIKARIAFSNNLGMDFIEIPSGLFHWKGSTGALVNIKAFFIQTSEVTQRQWKAVMGENPSYFSACGDDCPVENISWNEAQNFIQKLNGIEGTPKYRLPTEFEWEYACRAGKDNLFCFGNDERKLKEYSWYNENSGGKTYPVAQKKSNPWGLYDMHGNVWEWCQDFYTEPSEYLLKKQYPGPSAFERRVVRGGGWQSTSKFLSCSNRVINFPSKLFVKVVLRGLEEVTEPTNTQIKIINKRIKFHQGIELEPGKYHIKVSAQAWKALASVVEYDTQKTWVTIVGGADKNITIRLSPKSIKEVLGRSEKHYERDYVIAMNRQNKFRREVREKIVDEYLILKGKDALGITKEAEIWINDKIKEYEADLKTYYQRRYFRYQAEWYKNVLSLDRTRRHEIMENPDEFQEASIWRSNRVGFRLAMDR